MPSRHCPVNACVFYVRGHLGFARPTAAVFAARHGGLMDAAPRLLGRRKEGNIATDGASWSILMQTEVGVPGGAYQAKIAVSVGS